MKVEATFVLLDEGNGFVSLPTIRAGETRTFADHTTTPETIYGVMNADDEQGVAVYRREPKDGASAARLLTGAEFDDADPMDRIKPGGTFAFELRTVSQQRGWMVLRHVAGEGAENAEPHANTG